MTLANRILELEQQLDEAIDEGDKDLADELWVYLLEAQAEQKQQRRRA